jgi:hypothetical protein
MAAGRPWQGLGAIEISQRYSRNEEANREDKSRFHAQAPPLEWRDIVEDLRMAA